MVKSGWPVQPIQYFFFCTVFFNSQIELLEILTGQQGTWVPVDYILVLYGIEIFQHTVHCSVSNSKVTAIQQCSL